MYAAAPVPASRLRGGSPLGVNERVLSSLWTSKGVSRPILRLFLARTRGPICGRDEVRGISRPKRDENFSAGISWFTFFVAVE
jgi:hypothetical protein